MNDAVAATRLTPPVQVPRDHALGPDDASLTLVEYGSYACPFCHRAHEVIAALRARFGDELRYVFRQRPLTGSAEALQAAELAEYAHETTGQYWRAHDVLMKRGPSFTSAELEAIAVELGLPPPAEHPDAWRRAQEKVRTDAANARASGALYSPTFFINGRRYEGPWDESTLTEALRGSLGHRVQTAALEFARWAPSTGLLLLVMTLLALAIVNSPLGPHFEALWHTPVSIGVGKAVFGLPLRAWIDDGLLSIFFLVVGLEIKRELTVGRLADRRAAALPVIAAAGGMLVPALIYLLVVPGGPLAAGWAIATTTDTAFAVALIALLGPRVPVELRIFLTAVVVVDDLVAIAVVAFFYAADIEPSYLLAAGLVTAALAGLNQSGVYRALPYAALGILLWACLHGAGLHATLAGVVLAVFTPTRPPANLPVLIAQADAVIHEEVRAAAEPVLRHGPSEPALRALDAIHDRMESPADKLLRTVEPWSSYLVLPVFALANAGVALSAEVIEGDARLVAAIVLGLVVGKPVGIGLAALLAVGSGIAVKSAAYSWAQLAGAAALGGVGFTMSLYIASRAFPDPNDFAAAKIAVFLASLIAAALGTMLLRRARRVSP
ncbi:MAG TPA: Na+/H+ antiporter NhaA [Burkholderiales bacterium]